MPQKLQRSKLILSYCLIICLMALIHSGLSFAQSVEEISLKGLAEKYFALYQKKDLDGLLSLLDQHTVDYAESKRSIEQTFSTTGEIKFISLIISKVIVNSEKAIVRLIVEMSSTDLKTGKPAEGFGKLNWTLRFTKVGNTWRVSRSSSSENDLSNSLIAAKTEHDREILLTNDKDLITTQLCRTLLSEGVRLLQTGDYSRALDVLQLARGIAERTGDRLYIGYTLSLIGSRHT